MLLDLGFIYGSDFQDVTSSDSLQRLEMVITQFRLNEKQLHWGQELLCVTVAAARPDLGQFLLHSSLAAAPQSR